jgi:hypothetical protein
MVSLTLLQVYPPSNHWIGGWLDPRADLDVVEMRKIFLTMPGMELKFPCCAERSLVSILTELSRFLRQSVCLKHLVGRHISAFDKLKVSVVELGPPLWSSGQSFWLQTQRSRVLFPALPDFLISRGSGTGSNVPRQDNLEAT